ncbi:hypothetical protein Tco_0215994 [Tanacetum coccineum]
MFMTIQSNVKDKILATPSETSKVENAPAEMLRDLDQQMEKRADDGKANVVTDALSRKERVKPRRVRAMAMTIQYGVRGMILAAQSEAFNKEWNSGDDQLRLRWMIYLVVLADAAESVRDTIGFEYCLTSSIGWTNIRCAPFEALYGRKCRSPVLWAEIGESSLIGPELVQETTDKVVLIKEKLKAARDRQKSYADNRRKPLEFEVGDRVMLKVSPWKGVIRFGKKGKLAPRYVGPFEILERIGPVAYRLRLPEELSGVHDTFHVSNLKKCLADASLHVPLDEIKVDKTLRFVEEPVEIMDREVKSLKRSRILLVKVHWNSKRGPEFTWEREDHMKSKYPQLFVDRAVRSMALCSIGGVYVVRSMALCSIGGVLSIMREVKAKRSARKDVGMHLEFAAEFCSCLLHGFFLMLFDFISYAFSDSLLLTPLCCDDIHDVTPRVSALAGCDITP